MVTEKRQFTRRALEDLSAKLYTVEGHREIDFCPINVSKQGLSIFTSVVLAVGSKLILVLGMQSVILIVRWSKPKENDLATFRSGLECDVNDIALDELIKKELNF